MESGPDPDAIRIPAATGESPTVAYIGTENNDPKVPAMVLRAEHCCAYGSTAAFGRDGHGWYGGSRAVPGHENSVQA